MKAKAKAKTKAKLEAEKGRRAGIGNIQSGI